MKYHALTREAKLSESEFTVKRGRDVDYLMELKPENLLFSHYAEAGLNGLLNYTVTAHGGWDSPTSQIRGTFAGHWLSAAARACQETGNIQSVGRLVHQQKRSVCSKRKAHEYFLFLSHRK